MPTHGSYLSIMSWIRKSRNSFYMVWSGCGILRTTTSCTVISSLKRFSFVRRIQISASNYWFLIVSLGLQNRDGKWSCKSFAQKSQKRKLCKKIQQPEETGQTSLCGTRAYIARTSIWSRVYGKMHIYSLGVVTYELLTGERLIWTETRQRSNLAF